MRLPLQPHQYKSENRRKLEKTFLSMRAKASWSQIRSEVARCMKSLEPYRRKTSVPAWWPPGLNYDDLDRFEVDSKHCNCNLCSAAHYQQLLSALRLVFCCTMKTRCPMMLTLRSLGPRLSKKYGGSSKAAASRTNHGKIDMQQHQVPQGLFLRGTRKAMSRARTNSTTITNRALLLLSHYRLTFRQATKWVLSMAYHAILITFLCVYLQPALHPQHHQHFQRLSKGASTLKR
jgi:hypothetical protein